jgi:hypothetical protein
MMETKPFQNFSIYWLRSVVLRYTQKHATPWSVTSVDSPRLVIPSPPPRVRYTAHIPPSLHSCRYNNDMSLVYQAKDPEGKRRPGLYIGSKSDAKDLKKLQQFNVTHILNMTPSKETNIVVRVQCLLSMSLVCFRSVVRPTPIEPYLICGAFARVPLLLLLCQAGVPNYFAGQFVYYRIPVYDAPTSASELLDQADEICRFIAVGLVRGGSVLVHCQRGVSRSVTAVLFYLMR